MNPLKAAMRFWEMRSSWLGDGGQPVPQAQANARAAICLTCPKNQAHPLYEILTAPAIQLVEKQLKLRDELGLHVPDEEKLHVCECCWCILRLKIHVPLEHIEATTTIDGLPDFCWITTEASKK